MAVVTSDPITKISITPTQAEIVSLVTEYLAQIQRAQSFLNTFVAKHFTNGVWKEPENYALTPEENHDFVWIIREIPLYAYWGGRYGKEGSLDQDSRKYTMEVWDIKKDSFHNLNTILSLVQFLDSALDFIAKYTTSEAEKIAQMVEKARREEKELEVVRAALKKREETQTHVEKIVDTSLKSEQLHKEILEKGADIKVASDVRQVARTFVYSGGTEITNSEQLLQAAGVPKEKQTFYEEYLKRQALLLQEMPIAKRMQEMRRLAGRGDLAEIGANLATTAANFGERGDELVNVIMAGSQDVVEEYATVLGSERENAVSSIVQMREQLFQTINAEDSQESVIDQVVQEDKRISAVDRLRGVKQSRDTVKKLQTASRAVKGLSSGQIGLLAGTGVVVGAGALAGLVADGAAGLTGVLSSAGAGAAIGAAIGAPIAGVGALVGGAIGAIGGTVVGVAGLFLPADVTLLGLHSSTATGALGNASLFPARGVWQLGEQVGKLFSGGGSQAAIEGLSGAAKTAGGLSKTAAAGLGNTATGGLSGLSSFFQSLSSLPSLLSGPGAAATLVAGPMAGVVIFTTLVVMPTIMGSFLIEGQVSGQSNKYMTIIKQADPTFSEDPTDVTYTITIRPNSGYEGLVSISQLEDVISYASKTDLASLPIKSAPTEELQKLIGTLDSEKTITYTLTFSSPEEKELFDNTQIRNTLSLKYTGSDDDPSEGTLSTNASVIFGQPPIEKCWPTDGTILQGPFGSYSHTTSAGGGEFMQDAVDIAAPIGNPIYSPFSGTISFDDEYTDAGNASYGNHARLLANGYIFLFAHMSSFEGGEAGDDAKPIEKGDVIGYVGSTGRSDGNHLHYELRVPGVEQSSPPSQLNQFLPEEISPEESGKQVSAPLCGP